MQIDDFSNVTLIIVGHGSTSNPDSERPVFQHAAEVRRRGVFGSVREAFWKQAPFVTSVVAQASTPRIVVVPMFISEGYFTEEVIPEAIGFKHQGEVGFSRVQRRSEQSFYYSRPVGTHESMTKVILARATGVLEQFPFPRKARMTDTTLFIAGHGTDRNASSRRAIEHQADIVRSSALFRTVHAIYMEEEPRIAECHLLATTRNVVVVPFFISDGLHVTEDIPVLLGEMHAAVQERLRLGQPTWRNPTERNGKLIWYTQSAGSEPLLAEVIIERASESLRSLETIL